jgi:hypothetical protein
MEQNKKAKRISLSDHSYNEAVLIGKDVSGDLRGKAASAGAEIAIEHYLKTKDIDIDAYKRAMMSSNIEQSYSNTIDAINSISKNKGLNQDAVKSIIDDALLIALSKVMATEQ